MAVSDSQTFESPMELTTIPYFLQTKIRTSSESIRQLVAQQVNLAKSIASAKASFFANSAYYMGSKKNLGGFLTEAILGVLPTPDSDAVVVDLTCGSGAASAAFSRAWKTVASDSLQFCRILAAVQGGGFSALRARQLLKDLLPKAREHASKLNDQLHEFVEEEEGIFHRDFDRALLGRYQKFIKSFPLYQPKGSQSTSGWNPSALVDERRKNPKTIPYCLFTTYFANIYFGLRQSIEIDSLRFAIDQLGNGVDRTFCLGALIASASITGTTYAGHFAQPVRLRKSNLLSIIETRARSVLHEFSRRLEGLAQESEKAPRAIEVVPGPWRTALPLLTSQLSHKSVLVYVDAPYKREDYSRYYHVLETLAIYGYPSCLGSGRMPDITREERFKSKFSTRSTAQVEREFVEMILEILQKGWICAWSYSNSGKANIMSVAETVFRETGCSIRSFSTPYQHTSQGPKRGPKSVTEYLVVFVPKRIL